MFRAFKSTKYTDPDKYFYSGYGIGFDSHSLFPYSNFDWGNFGVDNSSSVHIDNKKDDILVLSKGLTQGLYDTAIAAEVEYSINFSRSARKFCFSLHYNGSNSFSFVYQLKAKDLEIKPYLLCLGNVSKDFTANNLKKQDYMVTCTTFCVDYNIIDNSNIINIHKYLMKKPRYKIMFGFVKKCFLYY